MKIQSISIVVPTKRCVNNCKFCVSKMHDAIEGTNDGFNKFEISKRIKYAQVNNITSCIITGTGEPLQNREYLVKLKELFNEMNHPFPNVELQTTGVLLTRVDNGNFINIKLLKELGVNTISLSVSNLFDDEDNMNIIGMPEKERYKLQERIFWLKVNGFNVRLSLNMTNSLDNKSPKQIFDRLKELNVDQVTFRELWYDINNDLTPESQWVLKNDIDSFKVIEIDGYIKRNGEPLYNLPYGYTVFSIDGMSTIIDNDCMSDKEDLDNLKYVVLQPDNKLYCRWDDKGSLIF